MSQELLDYCKNGNLSQTKKILTDKDNPININYQSSAGETALNLACLYGHLDIVKYLLTSNELTEHADIHKKTNQDVNALMHACLKGHLDIVRYLLTSDELSEKAKIHDKANNGSNIFIMACGSGHLDIVEFLLNDFKEYINIYDESNDGSNAFKWAGKQGHLNTVKYLLVEKNYQVDKKTMDWFVERDKYQVLEIIKTHDLYQKLNNNLTTNDNIVKSRKI